MAGRSVVPLSRMNDQGVAGSRAAARLAELAWIFLRLGTTSFGGPIAHLAYLRAELVDKRGWLDDAHFGDLVALCQFLPGPASSQAVFALGSLRAGLPGALVASVCFTAPSALLMIGFALGVAHVGDLAGAGWLHGLKLAAVAVVAQAVWRMGTTLVTDRARALLCFASAAVLIALPSALTQLGVIAAGMALGWLLFPGTTAPVQASVPASDVRHHKVALVALVAFALVLVLAPAVAATTNARHVVWFDAFYRSGALVFGGGHVVLPLVRAEVVPTGWLSDDAFLAGYGAAQAVPGPLFTFAAYLGTAMSAGPYRWLDGLWCLLAIFLPAWLLIGGALPLWHAVRRLPWAQAALAGANATVVGVLVAALYHPVITQGVHGASDVVAALLAFAALEHGRVPPWLVVVGLAGAGQWLLPVALLTHG